VRGNAAQSRAVFGLRNLAAAFGATIAMKRPHHTWLHPVGFVPRYNLARDTRSPPAKNENKPLLTLATGR